MDLTLLIGILIGFAAILGGFMIEGGAVASLLIISPAIIVIGGTIGATLASYPMNDIVKAMKALAYTFSKKIER
jgi:chemotaxis protein MotA